MKKQTWSSIWLTLSSNTSCLPRSEPIPAPPSRTLLPSRVPRLLFPPGPRCPALICFRTFQLHIYLYHFLGINCINLKARFLCLSKSKKIFLVSNNSGNHMVNDWNFRIIKFSLSEKATTFEKYLAVILKVGRFFSNIVAFYEKPNFTW